jgi:septal ring factor EnvC (AmiA/AmiB activator)
MRALSCDSKAVKVAARSAAGVLPSTAVLLLVFWAAFAAKSCKKFKNRTASMSNLQRQIDLTKAKQFLSHQKRQKFAALLKSYSTGSMVSNSQIIPCLCHPGR